MNILSVISSYFPSLTKTEQKVAQFILSNPDEIEKMSINELSAVIGTGESTIVRFCRKIGYSGFLDFKMAMAKNQIAQNSVTEESNDSIESRTFQEIVSSLEETKEFIKSDSIEEAAIAIHETETIYVFAVGNSASVAQLFVNRLQRMGKKVIFSEDTHLQAINASLTNPENLVIAISLSGNTRDIIDSIELAKNNSTKIVGITNYLNSSVAQLSDFPIICSSREYLTNYGSSVAIINQIYTIDVLCKKIGKQAPDQYHELRVKANQALMKRIK